MKVTLSKTYNFPTGNTVNEVTLVKPKMGDVKEKLVIFLNDEKALEGIGEIAEINCGLMTDEFDALDVVDGLKIIKAYSKFFKDAKKQKGKKFEDFTLVKPTMKDIKKHLSMLSNQEKAYLFIGELAEKNCGLTTEVFDDLDIKDGLCIIEEYSNFFTSAAEI